MHTRSSLILATVLLLSGCGSRERSQPAPGSSQHPSDIAVRYYKTRNLLFGITAKELAAVQQESFSEPISSGAERYRLVYDPGLVRVEARGGKGGSASEPSGKVVVRVDGEALAAKLTCIELADGTWTRYTWEPGEDPLGLFTAGGAKYRKSSPLREGVWRQLLAELDHAGFWQVPRSFEYHGGLDGSGVLLEGQRARSHQVVYLWLPGEKSSPLLVPCWHMLRLAKYAGWMPSQ